MEVELANVVAVEVAFKRKRQFLKLSTQVCVSFILTYQQE